MKRFLIRFLRVFGLAPASTVAAQTQLIAELREGSLAWKTKAGEAVVRIKSLEAELKREAHDHERLKVTTEKLRAHQQSIEQTLRERLGEAERALVTAREQLMLIDVKLDILEGAANVLDARTRTAIARPHSERVARV